MPELDPITKSQVERLTVIRLGIHDNEMDFWIKTGVEILMEKAGMPLRKLPYPFFGSFKVLFGESDEALIDADADKARTILLATSGPSEKVLRQVSTGDLDLGIVALEVMRASEERGFYAGELAFPGLSRATTIRAALVSGNPINPLVLESARNVLDTPHDRFIQRLFVLSRQCIDRAREVKEGQVTKP